MTNKTGINIKHDSPNFSMAGWDLLTYAIKRKKTLITVVASVVIYLISNQEIAAILAGGIVEMGFSLAEYYLKKV